MTSVIRNLFCINGVIDTSKPVMQNIQNLANAASSWVTFDIHTGKWSVVINQAGDSIHSFDDSNIIGNLNVSGTGLNELYNKVEVQYPHKDLGDATDYTTFSIPDADRFPNEYDNTLNIQYDLVNNPTQADMLAMMELKQSRVDKVVQFRTDFSKLGVKAGDIIDITNEVYGYTNKKFRVLTVNEEDGDDNDIVISITAFEYDEGVYSTSGLVRENRTVNNGIIDKCVNTAVQGSDAKAATPGNMASALGLVSLLNLATGAWKYLRGRGTQLNSNFAVITWSFPSGEDLDIRCRAYSPYLGQSSVSQYLGYSTASTNQWPASNPVMVWAGDNTGTGREQVAINIGAMRAAYPNNQYFIFECRGNWFGQKKGQVVFLKADLYQGGSFSINNSTFTFDVTGYTSSATVQGLDVNVYSWYGNGSAADPNYPPSPEGGDTAEGDLMGYFVYDTSTNSGYIINDVSELGFVDP